MTTSRVLRAQQDIVARYKRVANLWAAYLTSDAYPEDFGREFYHAVGEILEGKPLTELDLYHIDAAAVQDIIVHGKEKHERLKIKTQKGGQEKVRDGGVRGKTRKRRSG